jgi:RNA polymerase sigma-70 factor, ECF subfamily
MLRFARLHLSCSSDAEDVVQEAFAAILSANPSHIQQADPRAYVFGILRNKVMDKLRQRYRNPSISLAQEEHDLDELLFDQHGHWRENAAPSLWSNPEEHMQNSQFFQVVDACVNNLPTKPARVFGMKEFLDCEADEICSTLNISKSDYWQCLSRARKQIQLCLSQRWFEGVPQ